MRRPVVVLWAVLAGCGANASEPGPIEGTTSEGSTSSASATTATPPPPGTGEDGGSSSEDDGQSSDSGSGTTGVGSDRIPMFVAQGNIGRTVISCDDGHTWVADRAWDTEGDPLVCGSTDPVRCFEAPCSYAADGECVQSAPECDCGHHPGFAKGVTFGNGYFVATWGWGYSGSVRRSADGVHWEETLSEEVTFGGLAFGADRFVLSSRYPQFSTDGSGWTKGEEADFRGPGGEIVWSVRRFAFSDYDGGRFIATANPPQDVLVSSDGGQSWWPPSQITDACLADISTYGGIASGDGVIVGVGSDGTACRSTDGGDTWMLGSVGGDNILGRLLWTGAEFVTWAPGMRYTSPDGETWSSSATTPDGIWIGPAAYSDETGSFVAIQRIWDGYEDQAFLRSDNGIDWEPLPDGAFAGGHQVFEIEFGYGLPSEVCSPP